MEGHSPEQVEWLRSSRCLATEVSNFAWSVAEKKIRPMDRPAAIEQPCQLVLAHWLDALQPLELMWAPIVVGLSQQWLAASPPRMELGERIDPVAGQPRLP
jgi:hypothetical protein